MIVYNKTTLGIFAIVATLGILAASTALTIQPAHALSKFFNCTTAVANKTHNLTLQDVNACYNKEFHSSGGPGTGISPTTTTSESGVHRSSLHHHDAIRTSIYSPSSSSEGSHIASSHNEGFSSSSAAAAAASIDEIPGSDSGVDSSSSSASGDAAASSSSSSGSASASSTATAR